MKTEFMKAVIEDLHVTNCEQKQVDALLNCYEGVVKRMAAMLARTATFETDDFYRAKERASQALPSRLKRPITVIPINGGAFLPKEIKKSKQWQLWRS